MEIKKVIKQLENYKVETATKQVKAIVCKRCGNKEPYTFVVGNDVYIVCKNCLNIERIGVNELNELLKDDVK